MRRFADAIGHRPRLVLLLVLAVAVPGVVIWALFRSDRSDRAPVAPGGTIRTGPAAPGTAGQPGHGAGSSGTSAPGTPGSSGPATAKVWRPAPATPWQWQIVDKIATPLLGVAMYDVDLTDAVPRETKVAVPGFAPVTWPKGINAGIIDQLHAAGKIAICYLDTGAWEAYEPDAGLFPGTPGWSATDPVSDVIGNSTGWDNEYWLGYPPRPAVQVRADHVGAVRPGEGYRVRRGGAG